LPNPTSSTLAAVSLQQVRHVAWFKAKMKKEEMLLEAKAAHSTVKRQRKGF
jgi:hypothetical protein